MPLLLDPNVFKTLILTSTNGKSILKHLAKEDTPLVCEIAETIAEFSVEQHPIHPKMTTPVELTDGFRLLSTPVGSQAFVGQFFNKQIAEVKKNVKALEEGVPDLQTRLRIFLQCTIQKLPHLLGDDIMHNLVEDYFEDGTDWWDWNGPLTKNIVDIIRSFVFNLTGREAIPIYALIIAQISVGIAGLDLLYPSH